MHPRRRLLAVATAMLCVPIQLAAQTYCRPADLQTTTMISDIARWSSAASGDDKIVRDSLRLPLVPKNQLQVVTQEATCKKANSALQSAFANTGNNTFSGKVYVIQVGTVYGVVDPSYKARAADLVGPILFLDSRFKPLSSTL